jgi:hypothetical protein
MMRTMVVTKDHNAKDSGSCARSGGHRQAWSYPTSSCPVLSRLCTTTVLVAIRYLPASELTSTVACRSGCTPQLLAAT